jgi:hypothetical protein
VLIVGASRRLGHGDRVGAREGFFQPFFQAVVERLLAPGLAIAPGGAVFIIRLETGATALQQSAPIPFVHHSFSFRGFVPTP